MITLSRVTFCLALIASALAGLNAAIWWSLHALRVMRRRLAIAQIERQAAQAVSLMFVLDAEVLRAQLAEHGSGQ